MSQSIDDFRNFYKSSQHITTFNLDDVIQSTLEIVRIPMEEHEITLFYNSPKIELENYENELRQAILNILNNAKDALLSKRKKEVFTPLVEFTITKDEHHVNIEIYNNGGEIPVDICHRIFEPYFTTKFETQGTGIGLYMTKTLIEKNMKGSVEVQNIKQGVSFKIILPLRIGG
jgi:signal transduction histidine kinase